MNVHPLFPYQLYLVISEADCKGASFLEVAEAAILGGVEIIQLREKNIDTELFFKKARLLKEITDKYQVPLIINDNVCVAELASSAGIHVGNHDAAPFYLRQQPFCQDKIIGYSVESLSQLQNEHVSVSDYLGISPVFTTPTKTNTITEWGLNGITQIRTLTEKPLVAIGNIGLKNAREVIRAGANCIAVVSAICGAYNPQKAAYELKNSILK